MGGWTPGCGCSGCSCKRAGFSKLKGRSYTLSGGPSEARVFWQEGKQPAELAGTEVGRSPVDKWRADA